MSLTKWVVACVLALSLGAVVGGITLTRSNDDTGNNDNGEGTGRASAARLISTGEEIDGGEGENGLGQESLLDGLDLDFDEQFSELNLVDRLDPDTLQDDGADRNLDNLLGDEDGLFNWLDDTLQDEEASDDPLRQQRNLGSDLVSDLLGEVSLLTGVLVDEESQLDKFLGEDGARDGGPRGDLALEGDLVDDGQLEQLLSDGLDLAMVDGLLTDDRRADTLLSGNLEDLYSQEGMLGANVLELDIQSDVLSENLLDDVLADDALDDLLNDESPGVADSDGALDGLLADNLLDLGGLGLIDDLALGPP